MIRESILTPKPGKLSCYLTVSFNTITLGDHKREFIIRLQKKSVVANISAQICRLIFRHKRDL